MPALVLGTGSAIEISESPCPPVVGWGIFFKLMNYRSPNDVGPVVFLGQFNKYKVRPRANLNNTLGREFGVRKNLRTFLKNQSQVLMNWVELIEP